MSIDQQSRARLLEGKLVAIVRSRGGEPGEPESIRGGAAVTGPDGACWVLLQDEPERAVGMTLAWASRHAATAPTCVIDVDAHGHPQAAAAALAARKGSALRAPVPVWWIEGSTVHDAEPAAAEPRGPHLPAADLVTWADAAAAAALDVNVLADGSLSFEVLGLEVGRVTAGGTLQVGAGRHDRDATDEVWAGEPGREALVRAAEAVRLERRADRIPTQATTLQRERWLRRSILADPSAVGLDALVALADAAPAADLRRPRPAGAVDPERTTLVVCSAGADLDLIPTAADMHASHAPAAERILLVVPPGDDHRITRDLLPLLPAPAELRTIPPPWA